MRRPSASLADNTLTRGDLLPSVQLGLGESMVLCQVLEKNLAPNHSRKADGYRQHSTETDVVVKRRNYEFCKEACDHGADNHHDQKDERAFQAGKPELPTLVFPGAGYPVPQKEGAEHVCPYEDQEQNEISHLTLLHRSLPLQALYTL